MKMKERTFEWGSERHPCSGILMSPAKSKDIGVLLGHGAGGNMHAAFMREFQVRIAEAGYPCMRFNFPYSQAGRRAPDPQPVLVASFRRAMETMPYDKLVIGGKSMGGRIASYLGTEESVSGLLFLGYPLHPPGKPDRLRDEHLYAIRKPMLFVSGTRDPFARPELLSQTLHKIGKFATLKKVEGGGHSFEVPKSAGISQETIREDITRAIKQWLSSLK